MVFLISHWIPPEIWQKSDLSQTGRSRLDILLPSNSITCLHIKHLALELPDIGSDCPRRWTSIFESTTDYCSRLVHQDGIVPAMTDTYSSCRSFRC